MGQSFLHVASLGLYTHRVQPDDHNLTDLNCYRRAQTQIDFLDSLATAGTPPEVTYTNDRIQASIADLSVLLPRIASAQMRAHASATLASIRALSRDAGIQSDCSLGLASLGLKREGTDFPANVGAGVSGIAFAVESLPPSHLHLPIDGESSFK